MRERQRKRIVGSDSPPTVPVVVGPRDIRTFRSYKPIEDLGDSRREKEKEKTRLSYVLAGADASGELTIAPTLWKAWKGLLFEKVLTDGFVTANDAIHEFARILKDKFGYGSSVTTRRYLKETIGDNIHGDYLKKWNENLGWVIKFSVKMEKRLLEVQP